MTKYIKPIQTIYERGCYSRDGQDAIRKLVSFGNGALDAFLAVQSNPPQSDLHGRDLADTISNVFGAFADHLPDALIDRFESGDIGEFQIYWALGSAKTQRSIDVLVAGLKSKNVWSRWAAVESLLRRKSEQAIQPLISALKDRSSFVKHSVVEGLKSNRVFRTPEAIPVLKNILTSKSIQKHGPGTIKMAMEVVKMIESESQ